MRKPARREEGGVDNETLPTRGEQVFIVHHEDMNEVVPPQVLQVPEVPKVPQVPQGPKAPSVERDMSNA